LSWQRLADDSTKLSRELLCKKKVSRRARGSDTAGNVVHELRVAADALRIALALSRKFLGAFLLHVCQTTCKSLCTKNWSPLTAQAGTWATLMLRAWLRLTGTVVLLTGVEAAAAPKQEIRAVKPKKRVEVCFMMT
jgi:hypothetical protein